MADTDGALRSGTWMAYAPRFALVRLDAFVLYSESVTRPRVARPPCRNRLNEGGIAATPICRGRARPGRVPPADAPAYGRGMTRALILALLPLAACAEFPVLDTRIPEAERAAPPPVLSPLAPLLATADALPGEPGFAPTLTAAAQDLATRADALAGTAAGASEAERLAALQARAEALRDGVLSEEERERLAAGPSLP